MHEASSLAFAACVALGLLAASCSLPSAEDRGARVESLLGTSGTVTTEGAGDGSSTFITVTEELPFAPPGTETEFAGPDQWALCGFVKIAGGFGSKESAARIQTNARGFYEVVARQYHADHPIELGWSCIPLADFGGLSIEEAWNAFASVSDDDDSGAGDFQNDPTLSAFSEPERNIITWAGFDGPLTGFHFSDPQPNFVELGAFAKPALPCMRDRFGGLGSCGSPALAYEGNLVARTYTQRAIDGTAAVEITSHGYEIGVGAHTWLRAEEAVLMEAEHLDYLFAPTAENWCVLSGVSGGGQFDEPGAHGPISLEIYENANPTTGMLDYRVRIDSIYQRTNTRVYVECLTLEQ